MDMNQINEKVKHESAFISKIRNEISTVIVGQSYLIDRLLIGLLSNGHILVESVPGLAKTLSIKTLSDTINAKFQRLQFTPDLLPADIIGTLIYNPKDNTFTTKKGPIFANIVLADEINRAPAKVQSALLEAMQEKQVTIGENSFKLDKVFLVMATQNPIEQEGTYPLPEAQVDRFMLKLNITYPEPGDELEILNRMGGTDKKPAAGAVINTEDVMRARGVVDSIFMDEKLKKYVVDIIFATRFPKKAGIPEIEPLIKLGSSPRASLSLFVAAKAHAFLNGRGYVIPEDIKSIGLDVLRHRILPSYEAEAEDIKTEDIVHKIFEKVPIP